MNRKDFLKVAATATGSVIMHPFIAYAIKSKYTLALIGSGWWGINILREALKHGDCRLVALCDADENQLKKCLLEVKKMTSDQPSVYIDYRELLKKEKPEIVINATPDHWHALIAIDALNAGANVYLEKPIGHTVNEGKAIIKAVQNTGKTCIVGFHRRYSPHNVSGIDFIKSGKAGTIKEVRAFVTYNFWPGKSPEKEVVPQGLDWDLWCGPAPLVPYHSSIHPRGWRQRLEFANGQAGDWGPHWFDQILWWTDELGPKKIFSTASQKLKEDYYNAPESQTIVYEFEDFNCIWEHSNLNARPQSQTENVGVYFHGTEGTFHMGWQKGWSFYPKDSKKQIIHQTPELQQPDSQNIGLVWADFMQSIKDNKQPFADIIKGHRATNMSLLGMAALQAGRSLEWDNKKEIFINDKEANKLLEREYRKGWKYPT